MLTGTVNFSCNQFGGKHDTSGQVFSHQYWSSNLIEGILFAVLRTKFITKFDIRYLGCACLCMPYAYYSVYDVLKYQLIKYSDDNLNLLWACKVARICEFVL